MNLYIYSDESGVFDSRHYEWYAYGGLIFFDGDTLQDCHNEYSTLEEIIREDRKISTEEELKAAVLKNKDRRRLYQVAKKYMRFGGLVHLCDVDEHIFAGKKLKQRFLDYIYRRTVLHMIEKLTTSDRIDPAEIINVHINLDGHTAPTNSRYELGEAFEQDFMIGRFDEEWTVYTEPIFPNISTVKIKFCESKDFALVRAADIVANKVLHDAIKGTEEEDTGLILYRYK